VTAVAAPTIEEATSALRRQLLPLPGVVAVSHVGNTIVVYVERPEDAAKAPSSYMGFPVVVKVVGRVTAL
jgi:hypothetical protein